MVPKKKDKSDSGRYYFFGAYPEQAVAPKGYEYNEGLNLVPEGWDEYHEEQDSIDLNRMIDRQMAVESSYLPGRTSSAGATGLGQFRPIAQKEVVRLGIMPEGWDPNDPQQARDAMYGYMENLYDREWVHAGDSDPMVAYAKAAFAYNAGEGTAVSELNRLKKQGYDIYNSLDWIKEINKESREYIEQLAGMDTEKGRQFEENWPTFDSRRQRIFGEQS
jgi:soluble lytic murein transglycosylase-like protein